MAWLKQDIREIYNPCLCNIKESLQHFKEVRISHVFREIHRSPDWVANFGTTVDQCLVWHSWFPPSSMALVMFDPRRVWDFSTLLIKTTKLSPAISNLAIFYWFVHNRQNNSVMRTKPARISSNKFPYTYVCTLHLHFSFSFLLAERS